MNGTFAFGADDGPFDAGNPRTYPDLPDDPRRRRGRAVFEKAHYITGLRAGQVADEQPR